MTGKAFFEYRLKFGDPPMSVHPALVVTTYMGQCAVSRKASVTLAEVDKAIEQIVRDGMMARIMRRYQ